MMKPVKLNHVMTVDFAAGWSSFQMTNPQLVLESGKNNEQYFLLLPHIM